MSYLLDTSVIIGWFRGYSEELNFVAANQKSGLSISAVTYDEFYEGIITGRHREQRERRANEILKLVDVIPVDTAISRRFAELRAGLHQRGALFGDLDILIAATALEHDLELVTSNMRHFGRLPQLRAVRP